MLAPSKNLNYLTYEFKCLNGESYCYHELLFDICLDIA